MTTASLSPSSSPAAAQEQQPPSSGWHSWDSDEGEPGRRPILDLMDDAVARLCAVDVGDTAAVVSTALEAFYAAGAAAGLLALYGAPDDRPRWREASPALVTATEILQDAPASRARRSPALDPDEGHGRRLDEATAARMRQEIVAAGLGLNLVLLAAALDAVDGGDAEACRSAAVLATEITDYYEGH